MTAEKRDQPSSGQSGPPIHLTLDQLSRDQRKVYDVIWGSDADRTIDELSRAAFRLKPTAVKANSRVRNALRSLVRSRGVRKCADARGTYGKGVALKPGDDKPSRSRSSKASKGPAAAGEKEPASTDERPTPLPERLERRVAELLAGAPSDVAAAKERARELAVLFVAAEELGPSDTAIAKLTGYSRGRVIRRLKSLKSELPVRATPGFWKPEQLWKALRRTPTEAAA
jgi:hypothetical protein